MTGSLLMPSVQDPSHSAGQIRLVNSGNELVEARMFHAFSQFPAPAAALISGITLPSGQPVPWQNGIPQFMQRSACPLSSSNERVRSTSSKSRRRSSTGRYIS